MYPCSISASYVASYRAPLAVPAPITPPAITPPAKGPAATAAATLGIIVPAALTVIPTGSTKNASHPAFNSFCQPVPSASFIIWDISAALALAPSDIEFDNISCPSCNRSEKALLAPTELEIISAPRRIPFAKLNP